MGGCASTLKPRYMRAGYGNQQLHYFHFFAVPDRVNWSHLSAIPPSQPKITPSACIRILATHLESTGFDCTKLVTWHISHEYQKQMSKKSEVVCIIIYISYSLRTLNFIIIKVPLGVILKNENKTNEMVEIMTRVHQYVPTREYEQPFTIEGTSEIITIPNAQMHPILFGGDQLTAARARGAKKAKINSIDPTLRLDGLVLVPVAEDWHTRLNFIGVCMTNKVHIGSLTISNYR